MTGSQKAKGNLKEQHETQLETTTEFRSQLHAETDTLFLLLAARLLTWHYYDQQTLQSFRNTKPFPAQCPMTGGRK